MMNTGLTINAAANRIEMTKEFARKAKYFGTDEYNMLQSARKDYPTFSVTTKKTKSNNSSTIQIYSSMIKPVGCSVNENT